MVAGEFVFEIKFFQSAAKTPKKNLFFMLAGLFGKWYNLEKPKQITWCRAPGGILMKKARGYGVQILLILVLLLALPVGAKAAGHSHPICGASCSHSGGHGSVSWQPLRTTYNVPSGYYYLEDDIVLSDAGQIVTADNSDVVICLNGHAIRGLAYTDGDKKPLTSGWLIHAKVWSGGYDDEALKNKHLNLTFCDCNPNSGSHWYKEIKGDFFFVGSSAEREKIDKNYGQKNPGNDGWTLFRGGAVVSSNNMSALRMFHNTDLYIYGGTFMGDYQTTSGIPGCVNVSIDADLRWNQTSPTVHLYGGTFQNNKAYGIGIPRRCGIDLKGSPKLYNNGETGTKFKAGLSLMPKYAMEGPPYNSVPPIATISGPLGNDAYIDIDKQFLSGETEVVIAEGVGYTITSDDKNKFNSGKGYSIELRDNKLYLVRGHTHEISTGCSWEPANPANAVPFTEKAAADLQTGGAVPAGDYYLTEDVVLEKSIEISGKVNLCLNGYEVSLADGVSGSLFTVKTGGELNLCDCKPGNGACLTGGKAVNGGAICVEGGTARVYGVNMENNTATGKGGAVYVAQGGTLYMNSGLLRENTASEGGAVYNEGTATLDGVAVRSNTATTGGGIYNNSATLKLQNSSTDIENNTAAENGGGVYNAGTLTGSFQYIRNNKAQNGGGVYNAGNGNWTASRGEIYGNTAEEDGGGIYNAGTAALSGSSSSPISIRTNTATGNGGGIYDGSDGMTLEYMRLFENTAGLGEGVFLDSDVSCGMSHTIETTVTSPVYLKEGAYIRVMSVLYAPPVAVLTEISPTEENPVLLAVADSGYSSGKLTAADLSDYQPVNPKLSTLLKDDGKIYLALTPEHKHEDENLLFDKLLQTTGGNLAAGHYYLREDITLNSQISIRGEVHICLNGHTLSYHVNTGTPFTVSGVGNSLHIYNCKKEGCIDYTYVNHSNPNRLSYGVKVGTGGELYLHSGTIQKFRGSGVYLEGGTCTMYNGKIIGGGNGVYCGDKSSFTMHAGTLSENCTGVQCGNNSSFTMYGGSITNNVGNYTTVTDRGGIHCAPTGKVTLAGPVDISGNTNYKGAAAQNINLVKPDNSDTIAQITLTENFALSDPSKKIGIRTGIAPAEGSPVTFSTACGADYSSSFVSDDPTYYVVNAAESDGHYLQLSTESGPHSHDYTGPWQSDDDNHWKECTCGREDQKAPHEFTWQSDDNDHWQKCTVCEKEGSKTPHTWDDGKVTKEPTTKDEGEKICTCTQCGGTKTERIPKIPTYTISGKVEDSDGNAAVGIIVQLKQGNPPLQEVTTNDGGTYEFAPVPAGLYNVVAIKEKGTSDEKTMTTWTRIVDADKDVGTIRMPKDELNSKLEIKGDDPLAATVVVAGLSVEAEEQWDQNDPTADPPKKLTVQMNVEGKKVQDINEEEVEKIREEAKATEKTKLDFLALDVIKTVETEADKPKEEPITQTTNILRIVVPFKFAGKENVAVYRYHGDAAEALEKLDREPGDKENVTEGRYYLDTTNDLIHIYAKKFSTYAIGYEEPGKPDQPDPPVVDPDTPTPGPGPGGGGGGSEPSGYKVRLRKPDDGAADILCSIMSPVYTENGVSYRRVPAGQQVELVLTPDEGFRTANVRVLDDAGGQVPLTLTEGVYRYVQPGRDVTVHVLFTPLGGGAGCPRDETCPIWPYTDSQTRAWYHDGVHYCIEKGLMIGTGPETFVPEGTLSRGMMAQILYNRAGKPPVKGACPFSDLEPGKWYHDAVVWGAENKVLLGYGDGRFGPEDPVTREQMAAILWRISGSVAVEKELAFSDAGEISPYAAPALRWAAQLGVLQGYGDGTLRPRGCTSRAEAAQIMYNYFDKLGAEFLLP